MIRDDIIFSENVDLNTTSLRYYDPYDPKNMKGILPILGELKTKSRTLTKGIVRTILNGKILDDDLVVFQHEEKKAIKKGMFENIVVARGRRYIAQRLFNAKHSSDEAVYDWKVSHFGVGKGGAITNGTVVSLLGPDLCDQDLYDPVPLSGDPPNPLFLTSPGDSIRGVSPTESVVKPISPSGLIDVIMTNDIDCEFGPTFSYVRCVCVKSISEPNYLAEDDDYIMVNESCLYYSNGNRAHTFAHICFPPKYVEKKSEFVVEWYILC